ncbi:MAG: cation diffusion facilitator family transporter [Pseudomonadota bacterium]
MLSRGEKGNLNVRAAALHVMGDLLGSVGAIAASIIIMTTGWMPADPLLSVFVALIILRAAWRVVKESANILLEGAPENLDRREIAAALTREVSDIARVDHIHAWSITEERPMITMEVQIASGADAESVRQSVKDYMRESFGVGHSTVEIRM